MKLGRSLADLATELERQVETKRDYRVQTTALAMTDRATLVPAEGDRLPELVLTPWAHGQLAQDLGIPKPYYDRMLQERPQLLRENVNAWLHAERRTRLLRTLDGSARAWLSDRYRPLDNYHLARAALPVLRDLDTEIRSAELTDTRLYLKATLPTLRGEVVLRTLRAMPEGLRRHEQLNEVIEAGVCIRNSEVGHGAVALEFVLHVLVCTNLLISERPFRRYHIGRHAGTGNGDGDSIEQYLSDETRRLDDAAFWARFSDVLRGAFDRQTFDRVLAKVQQAAGAPIEGDLPVVVEVTAKRFQLTDGEKNDVLKHLAAGGDLSQWGLSNAITRAAHDADGYERATELERVGGEIIDLPPTEWRVLATAAS